MKPPRDGWDPEEVEALDGIQDDVEALRRRHETDPPAALLRAAHHDALPAELQEDARGYLSTHAWSRALVEGFDAADASLSPRDQDRLLARLQKAANRSDALAVVWWRRAALAVSALAVLALAALATLMWRGAHVTAPAPSVASSARPEPVEGRASAPGSTSSPRAGAAAAQPPSAPARQPTLPLEKSPLMLSAVALTWRGPGVGSQLLPDMKPAVEAYRKGNYALADR